MKVTFFSFFIILFSMITIDALWLGLMLKRFYAPNMAGLLDSSMKFVPVIIFYVLYAIALNVFVVGPGLKDNTGYLHVLLLGMLFGLVAYGTYDLTNQATLKNWPWILTLVDMAWGSSLTGLVSVISVYVTRLFW